MVYISDRSQKNKINHFLLFALHSKKPSNCNMTLNKELGLLCWSLVSLKSKVLSQKWKVSETLKPSRFSTCY